MPIRLALFMAFVAQAKGLSASSQTVAGHVKQLQEERARKADLVDQLRKQFAVTEQKTNVEFVFEREVEKSQKYLEVEKEMAEDDILKALEKRDEAREMHVTAEATAEEGPTTSEKQTQEQREKEIKKLHASSGKAALRSGDLQFVRDEIAKLLRENEKQRQEVLERSRQAQDSKAKQQQLAKQMEDQSDADLAKAEKIVFAVQAIMEKNKEKHMPSWMLHKQIQDAIKTNQEVPDALVEDMGASAQNNKKLEMWRARGKKLTCSPTAPAVKAFIMDSGNDDERRAGCLERQLAKYCIPHNRVPTVTAAKALELAGKPKDCLPKGVHKGVPKKKQAATMAKWCAMVQLLAAVTNHGLPDPYFLVLEDDVSIDERDFEETIKGFARDYYGSSRSWDLAQIDSFGKHSEKDEDMLPSYNGFPVFRNSRDGEYFGFHAVLFKTKSAPKILEKMMKMSAVPFDTLPTLLNEVGTANGIALQAFIAESPRAHKAAAQRVARERLPKVCLSQDSSQDEYAPPTPAQARKIKLDEWLAMASDEKAKKKERLKLAQGFSGGFEKVTTRKDTGGVVTWVSEDM